jgi:hypothetical protein
MAGARQRMQNAEAVRREIKVLPDHLAWDEQVVALTSGTHDGAAGLLALTDQRLIFLRRKLLGAATQDVPLSRVRSVEWAGVGGVGRVTITTDTAELTVESVPADDGSALASAAAAALAGE